MPKKTKKRSAAPRSAPARRPTRRKAAAPGPAAAPLATPRQVERYVGLVRELQERPRPATLHKATRLLAEQPMLAPQAWASLEASAEPPAAERTVAWQRNNVALPRTPAALPEPGNQAELAACLRQAVAAGWKVRPAGECWGFSNAVHTDGMLLLTGPRLDNPRTEDGSAEGELPLDTELFRAGVPDVDGLIRFKAGMSFAQVDRLLKPRGRILLNQPGFADLTFVGCAQSGGHGAGIDHQGISSQIAALELLSVKADGQPCLFVLEPASAPLTDPALWNDVHGGDARLELIQDDELFHLARCSMGLLGVVHAVTVRTRPRFKLEEHRSLKVWEHDFALVQQVATPGGLHSAHVWVNPYPTGRDRRGIGHTMVITTLKERPATARDIGERALAMTLPPAWDWLLDLARHFTTANPAGLPQALDTSLAAVLPDPALTGSFVVRDAPVLLDFGAPNRLPVDAASCAIDAAKVQPIIDDLLVQLDAWRQEGLWVSSPIGLRWVKASADPLSPQFGRDTVMVEVPILKGTPRATETLDRYVRYLVDQHGARPHWGQQNPLSAAQFRRVYAHALAPLGRALQRLDPLGLFKGPLFDQLDLGAL